MCVCCVLVCVCACVCVCDYIMCCVSVCSPSSAVPAQWLSSIAEDPKSRSFSWAGQVSA